MAAHGRTRRRNFWNQIGGYYATTVGAPLTERTLSYPVYVATCTDVVGNFPNPNAFSLFTKEWSAMTFSGEEWVWVAGHLVLKHRAYALPCQHVNGSLGCPPSIVVSPNNANAAIIKVMAATNPSRAVVSVPQFIGELKDIPSLVQNWGRKLIKLRATRRLFTKDVFISEAIRQGVPEGHLTWQWVIRPMISDISKILEFQKAVDDRFKLLTRLRDSGSIRGRTFVSRTGGVVSNADTTIESQVDIVRVNRLVSQATNTWASCQWKTTNTGPNATNLPSSDESLRALSERLVRGITGWESLQTAWELMPWSWFIDWFTHVGQTIAAGNNTVHANPGQFCVMSNAIYKLAFTHFTYKPAWIQADLPFHTGKEEVKCRQVVTLTSPASFSVLPLIDGGKWSILGELNALKAR